MSLDTLHIEAGYRMYPAQCSSWYSTSEGDDVDNDKSYESNESNEVMRELETVCRPLFRLASSF